MEYKFVPSQCKEKKAEDGSVVAPEFEGHFILKGLTYKQRLEMSRKIGLSGYSEISGEKAVEFADKLYDVAIDFIVSADIKRLDDGYKFAGLDEVLMSADTAQMVGEACGQVLAGPTLGKS